MSNTILEMKNVTKRFPGVVALNNISITLNKGEILAICGENGAGKSTLMKVLSGSYTNKDYEGQILIDGEKVEFTSVRVAEAYGIEMVYQELNMVLESSLAENLFIGNLPGRHGFVDYKALYANTQAILDQIHLDVDPRERAANLGSGQLQMLSIMRAIQKNPRILVLDEPTSALDETEVEILFDLLEGLRKKGVSCIFITHKLDEVFRIADRVVVMRDGEFVSARPLSQVTQDKMIEEMVGRKVENLYPKGKVQIGDVVMRVEHLSVPHPTIRGRNIVEDISFELRQGEILGIGGLVGSGRSETLGAVFGSITEGVKKQITVNGAPCVIRSPQDAMKAGIGFVTEERKQSGFVGVFTIRENLTLCSLKNMPHRFFIDKNAEKELASGIFQRLSIRARSMETIITNLSGGNQQKVVLGKSLLLNPRILLIDEPTKGIDVGAKTEIYKFMSELAASGMSIIMVSSDMPELVSMSDRCIVLSNSRITGEFTGDEISQDNIMRAAIAQ